ncbi:hypothetical protein BDD12DRAFT_104443 [Trichophaea hybrida]|nr:hypothetical protein BDD12DRAFT_104443 [Trichophaea hybrida]
MCRMVCHSYNCQLMNQHSTSPVFCKKQLLSFESLYIQLRSIRVYLGQSNKPNRKSSLKLPNNSPATTCTVILFYFTQSRDFSGKFGHCCQTGSSETKLDVGKHVSLSQNWKFSRFQLVFLLTDDLKSHIHPKCISHIVCSQHGLGDLRLRKTIANYHPIHPRALPGFPIRLNLFSAWPVI